MNSLLLITGYALISAYGLAKIKDASLYISVDFAIGTICYGLGFLVWLHLLRSLPLSIAFPIASGAVVIATQMFGFWLLGEQFSMPRLIGVLVIVGGIFLVYGSDTAT